MSILGEALPCEHRLHYADSPLPPDTVALIPPTTLTAASTVTNALHCGGPGMTTSCELRPTKPPLRPLPICQGIAGAVLMSFVVAPLSVDTSPTTNSPMPATLMGALSELTLTPAFRGTQCRSRCSASSRASLPTETCVSFEPAFICLTTIRGRSRCRSAGKRTRLESRPSLLQPEACQCAHPMKSCSPTSKTSWT